MAVFPLQVFTQDDVQTGFDEAYKSSPLGIRHAGQPKGAYVGFSPSVVGPVLTLAIDPTFGYSLVKVGSDVDPSGMDVIATSDVTLDFTGQPDIDFPMNVMVRAQYIADGTVPTSAEVFTRSATVSVSDTEALVCVVDGPAAALTVLFDPALQERDAPLAYDHVDFGFMPGGSIESLQAAADIVNEIIAARTGLDSTVYSDLSARIAGDYGAPAMASRLALIFRGLRSNDYSITAGETEITVSGSFSEIDRDFAPSVTLDGDGSETTEGAIAGPIDTIRNVVLLVDADTGYRPVDDPEDRQIVFGRIVGPSEEGISGEWRFLNASKDVTAIDGNGQATVEIEAGDTILGPDGKSYEVESVTTDNTIVLRTAYQGATDTLPSTSIRRWLLQLKKIVGTAEITASLPANATVRFFFPAFMSMERSNADWLLAMHTAAERTPLVAATTTVPGTVRLADTGALLGSINIQSGSPASPVAGGPFHTLNFNAGNASVSPTAPGEVQVVEIGSPGAQGPDGVDGAPGDPGGTGPGFSVLNPFEISPEFTGIFAMTVPFTFTKDMGHNVRFIGGNIAKWRDQGIFTASLDKVDILDISIPTATEGRIEGTIEYDNNVTLFLSSAGD
jgi:hypothetical protein